MDKQINKKKLKYLFAYGCWREGIEKHYEGLLERHRKRGYDVEGFCVTLNPPSPRINYPELDKMWKLRDRRLMHMYERLENKLKNFDVFILYNGFNIHEEFLKYISTFNVYICFDDPESSEYLSKPVAKYFDLALTGNVACENLYKSWGVKNTGFIPLGFNENDYNPKITEEDIVKRNRDINIIFLGERENSWRQGRLDSLVDAFPNMFARGRGWPQGYFPESERINAYQRSKVGINLHNSVGPVNLRTYMLPANGVMQICDNKHMLGYLFKLREEVIGYNSIDEAIALIQYYLEHEEERKRIAINGWKRALKDYSEEAVWDKLTNKIITAYGKWENNGKKNIIFAIKKEERKKNEIKSANKIKKFVKRYTNKILNHYGYEIEKKNGLIKSSKKNDNSLILPYLENPEAGPVNWKEKEKRIKEDGSFEWPNIIALNQVVVSLLGDAKKILEIGSGTGCFAWHAGQDKSINIVASEIDESARNWAIKNRSLENIEYNSKTLNKFLTNSFDLVVAVEIIEHIDKYSNFLSEISRIAPKAIVTTPNKNRTEKSAIASPPDYYQHVREWTTGEFYWVLKTFYKNVKLYAMPNVYVPFCVPININSSMTPIIGVCENTQKKE